MCIFISREKGLNYEKKWIQCLEKLNDGKMPQVHPHIIGKEEKIGTNINEILDLRNQKKL
jgi:hypothetical protein